MSERRSSQRKRKRSPQSDLSEGEYVDPSERSPRRSFRRSASSSSRRSRRSHCRRSRCLSRSRSRSRHSRRHKSKSRTSRNNSTTSKSSNSAENTNIEPEKCPICLKEFRDQKTAISDGCEYHTFCLACLQEWSKFRNTCPVDRKEYHSILELSTDGRRVVNQIAIGFHNRFSTGSDEPPFCEICLSAQDEGYIVQCDACENGFHVFCLNPPLPRVPNGMWLCYECCYYYNY